MPGDLVGGAYPLSYSLRKAFGLQANATQGNLGVRSNVEWFGYADITDATASLVSASMTVVAVPVENGDVFTTCAIAVGNTAAGTPTHQWVQLYTGALTTALPLGTQSVDGTSTAIPSKKLYTFTLPSGIVINTNSTANGGNAPYGYVYVGIGMTATTVPSLCGGNVAVNCQYARFPNSPPFLAGTISASGATAPTSVTLASVTAIATVPEVYLY
jgi:hypothetical protein